jgi:glycosyltransferase involved in cell wall biosynthesis
VTVVVLLDTVRPGTGGVASVLDLAAAIARNGHEVHLVVLRYDPRFQESARSLIRVTEAGRVHVHYVPGAALRWSNEGRWRGAIKDLAGLGTMPVRRVARKLMERVGRLRGAEAYEQVVDLLRRARLIIKAASLTGRQLGALRTRSGASIVQNHAGSPDAYEQYWLTASHRPVDADPSHDLYLAFCLGFDSILFQAEAHANACAARHPQLASRVIILPPTCDETAAVEAQRAASPFSPYEQSLVVVGTLQPRKGQLQAVEAFGRIAQAHQDAVLHLVGDAHVDPAYVTRLRAHISERRLSDRVRIHGHRDDYFRFLAHATMLVQSSEAEGVPRVIREAMLARVPIVGFALPGIGEIVAHGRDACLVQPGDVPALTAAISELLRSRDARVALADSARRRYEEKHSRRAYDAGVARFLRAVTDSPLNGVVRS